MLDSILSLETPEGVLMSIRPAGPTARAIAFALDLIIRGVVLLSLSLALGIIGDFGQGFFLVGMFLLEWFYPVLFEMYNDGQTLGKRVMGLTVINEDGAPLSWRTSMLRNLMRTVDLLPMAYLFGLVAVLVNRRFQRIGDLVAGTLVVYVPERERTFIASNQSAQPLSYGLKLPEQRALIAFAERGTRLSEGRRIELANILKQFTGKQDSEGVDCLIANANWAMGRRT